MQYECTSGINPLYQRPGALKLKTDSAFASIIMLGVIVAHSRRGRMLKGRTYDTVMEGFCCVLNNVGVCG